MLSRTADNLFWMARYIERADNVARILDDTGRARGNRRADCRTGQQGRGFCLQGIVQKARLAEPGLHGLWPRLHQIEQAALAVLGPFEVHRPAIVFLNNDGLAG